MAQIDGDEYHNRYIMYDTSSKTRGWSVDIINKPNGNIIIKVNGKIMPKPPIEYTRLVKADSEMMAAISAFVIAGNVPE